MAVHYMNTLLLVRLRELLYGPAPVKDSPIIAYYCGLLAYLFKNKSNNLTLSSGIKGPVCYNYSGNHEKSEFTAVQFSPVRVS